MKNYIRQDTPLAKFIKTKLPIIQAPMAGGATTPELVAAVSNAGGLGSFAAGYLQPQDIRVAIKKIRNLTDKPFSVNLFVSEEHYATQSQIENMQNVIKNICPELNLQSLQNNPVLQLPSFDEQIKVILDEKVPVFSFTFGIPSQEYIAQLKNNHTILVGTATNIEEAQLLEKAGIDIIVAQGSEAGGHRGTFIVCDENSLIGLMALIPQIVDHVNIPVIAAGGIMNIRGILAALALGASGVQMGTAFLTCHESGVHLKYKDTLLNTKADNTVLTKVFSGKLARGIKNAFIERMQTHNNEVLDYPIQNSLTVEMRKIAALNNNTEFMALWAGQAAYLCESLSASELIKKLSFSLDSYVT